jgi:hypothetical protein
MDEHSRLRSQFVTLEIGRGKYSKYLPFAFTEQGVAMLSFVLNSKTAIAMNINIMRAFNAVRHLILNPPIDRVGELQNEVRELKQYVENVLSVFMLSKTDEKQRTEISFVTCLLPTTIIPQSNRNYILVPITTL